MGTTIDDVKYDMHIQEEWENERRAVFEALENIANSKNITELQNNLSELRDVYSSDVSIDNESVSNLIQELDLSLPKLKEYLENKGEEGKKIDSKYFYVGIIIALILSVLGIIF
ncbi:hypothetical protein KAJ89_02495 [Candidatus Parcubacteria bacterium]|nr:hypothetical protein [Candidatus Parcubacteria bacterium]